MDRPLSGVKVVELASFVAAPSCGRLLADLGAEVIKVEAPSGDMWRTSGKSYIPSRFCDDENPVFDIYNTGKKMISLNLKNPEGKEAFFKLLETADVFLTNNRPAALHRLGIAYEDICEQFPGLVYAILLGYGEKGPDSHKPAFDTTAFWTKSGFLRDMAMMNENYMPMSPPFGVGDTFCGYLLMGEICAALFRKLRTGKGDYVCSGLYHNAIFGMGTMNIINQRPFGKTYPTDRVGHGLPGGVYCCADGEWMYIGTNSRKILIEKLTRIFGEPEKALDPTFVDQQTVVIIDPPSFYEYFRQNFAKKTRAEWLELLEAEDIPVMPMKGFADVSEDPQAWENDYLEHVEFANGNVEVMPTSPIEMLSVGKLKTVPAAAVGTDTKDVLAQLGYSAERIEAMLAAGAAK